MTIDTIGDVAMPSWLEQILSNPWIISIASGLLTSIIVYIITKPIIARRKKRELEQKATSANHEVLYALRSGIPNGNIPENNIINRLIEATAKKYGIAPCDMLSIEELFSDIIKEVLDSAFITSEKKIELCNKLNATSQKNNKEKCKFTEKISSDKMNFLSIYVAIISIPVSILTFFLTEKTNFPFKKLETILPVIILTVILATLFLILRTIELKEKDKQQNKDKGNTD
ncbi:hypothetical protein HMPREF1022_00882 [Desulfovibrio sp. 6_1_46AFAA]|uniref:hypothetical protein n=1 Tax=Desulfovibrio sp. 6_1_46AFAA TaxID=665942 RepID=UPI00022370EF|nr:hypothetical protein [Desulfovibrio sp. 6_1_46AFAA]EGW52099.1 hypothetical protein HMPREF1022_00882 [Desulfovibrio sp. 6_1_46AFAA]